MLVVSREEKHLVALDGSAESAPELVLLTARLESHKRRAGRERTIPEKIEPGSVPVIRAQFRHHVDHRSARAPEFRSVSVGRNAELLYDLVRKLIRRPIPSPRLREEAVVIVGTVDQIARLVTANAPKG